MEGQTWTRVSILTAVLAGLVGCAVSGPTDTSEPVRVIKMRSPLFQFREPNHGRLVGTMVANDEILGWADATSLAGTEVHVYDPDGTELAEPVEVDANGNFLVTDLKDSRPRIFVEAVLNGKVRYSATVAAPHEREDVSVTLDAASTYLADKLRLAAMHQEVPLDQLDSRKVTQTEQIVNIYLKDDEREKVHTELDSRLNAFAFDHFMDDHLPVKTAVYQLSHAITLGWKPPTPSPAPTPTPRPTPPRPTATPTDAGGAK